jgi:hypothetical protein
VAGTGAKTFCSGTVTDLEEKNLQQNTAIFDETADRFASRIDRQIGSGRYGRAIFFCPPHNRQD